MDAVKSNNSEDHIRYIVGEELGSGQFGITRKCFDKATGEMCACKSIPKSKLATPEAMQSVKLEVETMAKLSGHPNIVNLKAVHEEEEYVHLVMELCSGGELFDHLQKHGKFSETKAKILFRSLMQVVAHCHNNGIVHRDLKPENILLANNSSSSPIKLADFGLATFIKPGECLHEVVGSAYYIAPEVLGQCYGKAADVWSAGIILYILLCGVPPFWGETSSQILNAVKTAVVPFRSDPWDRVSGTAKKLVKAMLQKEPSKRLTAHQVLEHPWMSESTQLPKELCAHNDKRVRQFHTGEKKMSTGMMSQKDKTSCRLHHFHPSSQNHGLVA